MPNPNVSNAAIQNDIQRVEEKLDNLINSLPRTYAERMTFERLEVRTQLLAEALDKRHTEELAWSNANFTEIRKELTTTRENWLQARIGFYIQLSALFIVPLLFLLINHYWR